MKREKGPASGVTTASPQLRGVSPRNPGRHAKPHHGAGESEHAPDHANVALNGVDG